MSTRSLSSAVMSLFVVGSSFAQVVAHHAVRHHGMKQPVRQIRQIRHHRILTDRDHLRHELVALRAHLVDVRHQYGANSREVRTMKAHIRKLHAHIEADNRKLRKH